MPVVTGYRYSLLQRYVIILSIEQVPLVELVDGIDQFHLFANEGQEVVSLDESSEGLHLILLHQLEELGDLADIEDERNEAQVGQHGANVASGFELAFPVVWICCKEICYFGLLALVDLEAQLALPDGLVRHGVVDAEASGQLEVASEILLDQVELIADQLSLPAEGVVQQVRGHPLVPVDGHRGKHSVEIGEGQSCQEDGEQPEPHLDIQTILVLMAQARANIEQYTPQELYQIKQGFEGEITTLGQSMNQLRFALEKYEEGKRSIRAVEECREEEELLMPLSNSLYIQGYLNNRSKNEKVYLVEYGAGFFVERTAKESTEFYNRKIVLIKERLGKLQEIIQEKREGLRSIEVRMLTLIQQQQQQQQQQRK